MIEQNEVSPEDELAEIELSLANIKGQIAAAKARQRETGEYADPVWFAKANTALKYKQARHQYLLRLLAHRKRQIKKSISKDFAQAFVDASREILDLETFEIIRCEARRAAGLVVGEDQ